MPCDALGLRLATAVALGLATPAPVASRALTLTMPLCGGGSVVLHLGGRHGQPESQGACHAGCAFRRDEDDPAARA